ncbi:MAG: EAL domain-containing protein [Gammaproteobacteria bacterium]|nr:EAL domain-containing protein [Gammaproteobacteria bacterium]
MSKNNRLVYQYCRQLLLGIFISWHQFGFVVGEPLFFKNIDSKDGLSQSSIIDIHHSRDGYIWLATQDGLNRYDGYQLKVYKHLPDDPHSLAANFVWSIAEDVQGYLWIGTENGGLSRFNPKTDSFDNFKHNENDPSSLPGNQVLDVFVDTQNRVWIATAAAGLALFNRDSETFTRFQNTKDDPNRLNSNTIKVIKESRNGKLWLGYSHAPFLAFPGAGFSLFDPETGNNLKYNSESGLSDNNVTDFLVTTDNKLWITSYGGGLDVFDPETKQIEAIKLPKTKAKSRAMSVAQDAKGTLWIPMMSEGLIELDPETRSTFLHKSIKVNDLSLSDNSASQILIDDNLLWVGTWQAGLHLSNLSSRQFGKLLASFEQPNSLSSSDVTHISFSDTTGHIWLANGSDLIEYDIGLNLVKKYPIKDILKYSEDSNVLFVHADSGGRIWFNSRQYGLHSFTPSSNSSDKKEVLNGKAEASDFNKVTANNLTSYQSLISNRRITVMTKSSDNQYLIGSRASGLVLIDLDTNESKKIEISNGTSSDSPLAITKDGILRDDIAGGWWVATTNYGLKFLTENYELLNIDQINREVNHNIITSLALESNNELWLGTQGQGLLKLTWQNEREVSETPSILSYSVNEGLASSSIGTIYSFENYVWLTTTQGLSRFDKQNNTILNFSTQDGALGEYSIGVGAKVNNELLIVAGFHGASYFYPSEIKLSSQHPKLVINELLLSNKNAIISNDNEVSPLQNSVVEHVDHLTFHHANSHFTFGFSALEFVNPDLITYAYRLKGFDSNWLYTTASRRFATYTNLDSGNYLFELKSSDRFGRWSGDTISISLTVEPAPWRSWWAYLLYVMIFLTIATAFLWQRLMKIKVIKERNEQLSITSKLFENTSEGVILFDENFRITVVNQGYCDITGFNANELTGQQLKLPDIEDQKTYQLESIFSNVQSGGKWRGELWAQRKDGDIFPIEIVVDQIENTVDVGSGNSLSRDYQYVAVLSDITQRKKDEKKLKELAYYDELTLLPNRSSFEKIVELEIESNSSYKLAPFAVMFIDLDNFKSINDSLGHNVGDKFLQKLAKSLRSQVDARITIGRLGGDEFLILAPVNVLQELEVSENLSTSEAAVSVAQSIFESASKTIEVDEYRLRTTCSIGIAIYPKHGMTFERLLRNADTAMYEAKKDLYHNIHCYDKQMNVFARYQFEVAEEIREDIKKRLFMPYYQAKADTKTGKMCGIEVLTRWHNKKLGWIEPIQFIPIAEERGLINILTEQVIELACEQILPLVQQGKLKGRMSINLSPVQFHQVDIVERILAILKKTNFPTKFLEVEVTESVAIHDRQQALEHMHKIRDAGIQIALDDFGTGYSSLSYLHKYPLNIVKIDRSFVGELMVNNDNQKVTSAIIGMSHSLGMTVTAEGVEDTSQLKYLIEQRCDYVQGYLFHKPCDIQGLIDFIDSDPKLF